MSALHIKQMLGYMPSRMNSFHHYTYKTAPADCLPAKELHHFISSISSTNLPILLIPRPYITLSQTMPPLTYEVFRGSEGGIIIPDNVSSTLEHGEVFIETTHSGLCGTDEHYLKSGQVLGHEGVGIVKALGTAVTSVRIGDRVGFGYTHQICGNCDRCSTGQ